MSLMAKEVLDATGGLPVYAGWVVALAITPDGEVVEYDWDGKSIQSVQGGWRTFALRRAARRFDVLRSLEPRKPDSAVDCRACGGRGVVTMGGLSLDCGVCWGGGWIP